MKYRVRLDLSFDNEADAQALMTYAKDQSTKAVSINEGLPNAEIAFCDLEICYHDDPSSGKGCEKLERLEIRKTIV
ncbi:MAG: hypothetical protein HY529_05410 [Chloroflexi bacterium]|nr:hypothetical protein [Chloroflexota bacterium]